ncbi:MAG: hypothetical protein KBF14_00485 [Synergistaceae bacterium]|nr:hypothetical protein [Synergistaceae bacterium]
MEESMMIALYVLLLFVSVLFFYFTRSVIPNTIVRFSIVAAFFVIISTLVTVMLIRGHAPPPGAKTVDMEEMKRIHRELKKNNP